MVVEGGGGGGGCGCGVCLCCSKFRGADSL